MRRTRSRRSIGLHPGRKWRMHPHHSKFQSQNVQIFGYVYQNTNGPNHGPAWKTQFFFLNGICTVILWQDCYGKVHLKISAEAIEKLPHPEKLGANMSSWSWDMEGHAKKCVQRDFELANKTTQQLFKVATPCIDRHQLKEEELGSVGELSKVCAHIVLTCLHLARLARPDIFMVREQACSCHNEMDESMRQTFSTFDLLHSSYE